MSQPIQQATSLPDAVLLAAERAETERRKYMVLEQETESGDIRYGAHPMNVSTGPNEDLSKWTIRLIIEAKS